jgi:hypothetical protein
MTTVAGVFRTRERAQCAARDLSESGLQNINLIAPDSKEKADAESVIASEQPGMGAALGGVLGGALGIAGGLELGTAATSLLLPGVGPVLAIGAGVAALFAAAGVAGGAAAGAALEQASTPGLPADELFVYKDALRQGRSVLFVHAEDSAQADIARKILKGDGAESTDAAREEWWIGLRSAEKEHYIAQGRDFETDEKAYRCGFEAAVCAPDTTAPPDESEAYRCGFERGKEYARARSRARS